MTICLENSCYSVYFRERLYLCVCVSLCVCVCVCVFVLFSDFEGKIVLAPGHCLSLYF